MTSSLKLFFNSLLYKTNRFQVAVRLFSNRSQRTSKCGKNISDTLGCASCATFLFLPHFDVLCDLLLNRRTATWNLFVKYKLWASRRFVISHPWHIVTRLQCTFSFISCHVGCWWKLMSDDNSLLKCHLRQIIQSVNGCFKFVIFINTNAHFMACRILMILYFHFAAQQVWRNPMKHLEWNIWKKKKKKIVSTFLHGIVTGVKLKGSHTVDN